MKAEDLAKGKKLADESLAWHRSTMPFPDEFTEEPIPKFIKWFKQAALPELEISITRQEEGSKYSEMRHETKLSRRKK